MTSQNIYCGIGLLELEYFSRFSAVLVSCIRMSRANVDGWIPTVSCSSASSSVGGHSVHQWASKVTGDVEQLLTSYRLLVKSVLWQREWRTTNHIAERTIRAFWPSGKFHPHSSSAVVLFALLPVKLPRFCESQLVHSQWGSAVREADEMREQQRCNFTAFLNASQAYFLLLLQSEVRSSGFNPVWEDEERKRS